MGAGRSKRLPVIVLWLVVTIVIVVDQVSERWVLSVLSDGRHTALSGRTPGLVPVCSPGAVFSFATGQTRIFTFITSCAVAITIRVSRNLALGSWTVVLGLVLGDAVGNLVNRLLREPGSLCGHVIGFIDYGDYFVGNVADIVIMAAAAGIIILPLGGWKVDDTRIDALDDPGAEGGGASPSPVHRGVRVHGEDRAETPSKPGEPSDASTQAAPVEP